MPRTPSRRTVSSLGEFELITLMKKIISDGNLQPPEGIGDDAAVLKHKLGYEWLVSKDLLIEGIHFDPNVSTYRDIGYKAAAVNISDIAAMGGIPQFLLVGLAMPKSLSLGHVQTLYRGLNSLCKEFEVKLIGGDTSASKRDMFISLTIIGKIKSGQALCRKGAKVGDLIYVTGTLGDSGAGLRLLQRNTNQRSRQLPQSVVRFLIKRHRRPTPRVNFGRLLSERGLATAAIDLSDGLSGDLYHICQASKVGAVIDAPNIPISSQCTTYAKHSHDSSIHLSLHSGEDYELLFTTSPNKQKQLERIASQTGQKITSIGMIQRHSTGINLKRSDGSHQTMPRQSYDHFQL